MKIALAVHHFPPKYSAGAELRAFRTARWLTNQGHDVQVITIERIDSDSKEELISQDDIYQGIRVHRISFDIARAQDKFIWEYENPWINDHLSEFLGKLDFDLFHLISGYLLGAGAINAALSNQIPIVITLTDFWFFCRRINLVRPDGKLSDASVFDSQQCTRCKFEEDRIYRLAAKLMPAIFDYLWDNAFESPWEKFTHVRRMKGKFEQRNATLVHALSQAQAIVCPSQFLIDVLLSRGFNEEKLHYIQHGLDKSNWAPVSKKKEDGIFRIGYLGQIDKHKGVHLLIEAFKHLDTDIPLELWIYGDGLSDPGYYKSLRKFADLDPRIRFLGRYEYSQVANIFSDLGVLVIPSIWNEIGPWVMYEAFETRTPVIASDIPNMSHIIDHDHNGLLFKCGNTHALKDQLQKVVDDPVLRRKLIDGIKPVNTLENEMEALFQIYQNIT